MWLGSTSLLNSLCGNAAVATWHILYLAKECTLLTAPSCCSFLFLLTLPNQPHGLTYQCQSMSSNLTVVANPGHSNWLVTFCGGCKVTFITSMLFQQRKVQIGHLKRHAGPNRTFENPLINLSQRTFVSSHKYSISLFIGNYGEILMRVFIVSG